VSARVRASEACAAAVLAALLLTACAPRNAILEVDVPVRTTGTSAVTGLSLQVRVLDAAGAVRALGPIAVDAASSTTHRYSIEAPRGAEPFVFEVCLCEDPAGCFDAAGTCRGSADGARGGAWSYRFPRAHYVGERTRWTASDCSPRCTDGVCPLRDTSADMMREACPEQLVDPCDVEGCCGAAGCDGVDRRLPEPFCIEGQHFCGGPATTGDR